MITPTLFSVSYAGLWGQHRLDLPAFLTKAAKLGYPAVEVMAKRPHLSPLDFDEAKLVALRQTAERAGVRLAVIAGYTDFAAGRETPEIPFVEMQVAHVRSLAQMAKLLGAGLIRVFTGYSPDPAGYQADWDKCVRGIREAAALAQTYGVTLAVQNHHDVGVGVEAFAEFLDDVGHPNCKAAFDPWAPALHDSDLRAWARRLAPRMVMTTFADYVRLPRYAYMTSLINYQPLPAAVRAVPLGEGFVDLAGFCAGLKEGGFAGHVSYEMCSPLRGGGGEANLDSYAATALTRIRQWIP
jgi:sugar phosphate isomerase/epimerase